MTFGLCEIVLFKFHILLNDKRFLSNFYFLEVVAVRYFLVRILLNYLKFSKNFLQKCTLTLQLSLQRTWRTNFFVDGTSTHVSVEFTLAPELLSLVGFVYNNSCKEHELYCCRRLGSNHQS